jgi:hypothetical protein
MEHGNGLLSRSFKEISETERAKVESGTTKLGTKLESFLGTETNGTVQKNAEILEKAEQRLVADIVTPEIRSKSIARCIPQATTFMRLGFESPEGTDPLKPLDPTEKPLEMADLERTKATQESFQATAVPLSSQIEGRPVIPSVLPTDPGFSLTVPPPMLPIQPGETAEDLGGNPCNLPGRRIGPVTAENGNGLTIDSLMPLTLFVRENMGIIVIVLLAVIVLRGR